MNKEIVNDSFLNTRIKKVYVFGSRVESEFEFFFFLTIKIP